MSEKKIKSCSHDGVLWARDELSARLFLRQQDQQVDEDFLIPT